MSSQKRFCSVCKVYCDTDASFQSHEMGKKHRSNCLKLQSSISWDCNNQPLKISLPLLDTPESSSPKFPHGDMSFHFLGTETNSTSDFELPMGVTSVDSSSKYISAQEPILLSGGGFTCVLCNAKMNSSHQVACHIRGRKHRSNINATNSKASGSTATLLDSGDSKDVFYRCDDCKVVVFNSAKAEHLASADHILNASKMHRRAASSDHSINPFLQLREYRRCCEEFLGPVWSSVAFTVEESEFLKAAARDDADCILPLSSSDGRSRVGVHLANALLIANRNSSTPHGNPLNVYTTTCVVWIVVEKLMNTISNFSHSTYTFQPGGQANATGRSLIFAYPPFDIEVLSKTDIVRTTSDLFMKHVAWLLMQQKIICGIIIEDIEVISEDVEFCELISCYLKVFPNPINRGRIICFTESKVEADSIFSSFKLYDK